MSSNTDAVRHFNRFYTRHIGVLNEGLLASPFSLTEARVIYELAQRGSATATELGNELELDPGYLSRIIRNFEQRRLVNKKAAKTDARQSVLSLTARGRKEFAKLNQLSRNQVDALLHSLSVLDQKRLLAAMKTIEEVLDGAPADEKLSYILRLPQAGDMGWVVQANGTLYAQEYGWDESYEALVAKIVADFVKNLDAKKERCWIAEKDGQNVGSVFLVKESDQVAKLRLLIVDPKARGLGIGKRLVAECTRFARQAGYKKITLWTNSVLLAARKIYQQAGYKLVKEEKHHSFGHDLVGETWELEL
ncbi:MAG TPA: helix-turn-helix domain-containing GNAT family N-acetyltransferase [Pyrinomonadaceae bacterium]|nr:helix-turn-helix domain-containing GNAT family N-acetyltransferase [Pyrinomonadaceae bacterium]